MLAEVHIVATQSDIVDCCRLGKNGSAIVNLSRESSAITFWKKSLTGTKTVTSLILVFGNDTKIYVSENLTHYN